MAPKGLLYICIYIMFYQFDTVIELDDGKILTGKPDQFDGKNPWVSGVDFPNKTNPLI